MSASSSPRKSSNSKPLNPSALSYEPQSLPAIPQTHYPQYKIYLPHQFPLETNYYGAPSLLHQPQVPESPAVVYPASLPDFSAYPGSVYCYSPWCFYTKEEYLNLYNSKKQPYPLNNVFNSRNHVPYSEGVLGKKKGKWGFVPPRFKLRREHPMDSSVWVPRKAGSKKTDFSSCVHGGRVPLSPPLTAEEKMKLDGKTSLMIRNIPNHYGRSDLIGRLDNHCRMENRNGRRRSNFCKSAYDFLYLPMDFGFHLNLGYAFVNFTSPDAAVRFYRAFNKLEWRCKDGRRKFCEIGVAKFQGRDSLKGQLQKSNFPCHSNEYLPVIFSPPRDGSNHSTPTLIGRRTGATSTSTCERVMIMTIRKNREA